MNQVITKFPHFFVSDDCIYCGLCSEHAPACFDSLPEEQLNFVYKQPKTDLQAELCEEAMDYCPVGAIHKKEPEE